MLEHLTKVKLDERVFESFPAYSNEVNVYEKFNYIDRYNQFHELFVQISQVKSWENKLISTK